MLNKKITNVLQKVKKRKIHVSVSFLIALFVSLLVYLGDRDIILTAQLGVFCLILTAIAYVDFKKNIIPNFLVGTILLLVILINLLHWDLSYTFSSILAFVVFGAITYMLHVLSKEALGMGDVKLLTVTATLFGITEAIALFFVTFVLSALIGIVLISVFKKSRKQTIAFAPMLLLGLLVSVIFNLIY